MNEVKHNVGAGLMIGIPTLGRPVPLEWALNFKSMNPPINYNVEFNIIYGKEIGAARQALAEAALVKKCKYLFFLGDDVVAPPHALRQLIFRMENFLPSPDVVGGVYCAKADPPSPLVFKENGSGSYWDWKIGEFFECSGLGMDCTLIRTSVFENLGPAPWFKTVDLDGHVDGKNNLESWTEDLFFLKKVTDSGGKIFCDAAIICDHWDVYQNKKYQLPSDSLPMRQKTSNGKKCLMLGPKLDLAEGYSVVRCTQDSDYYADYRVQYDCLPFAEGEFDFVCVTEPLLDIARYLPEVRRVAKPEAKIAFQIDSRLNPEYVKTLGVVDGSFVEVRPDANTISQ